MAGEPRFSDTPAPFTGPPNTVWDAQNKKRVCADDLNQMAAELDAVWEELVTTYCRHDVYGDERCPANSGCRADPCSRAVGFRDKLEHGPDCLQLVRLNLKGKLGI